MIMGGTMVLKPRRKDYFVVGDGTRTVRLHSGLGDHVTLLGIADLVNEEGVPPVIISTTQAADGATVRVPLAAWEGCPRGMSLALNDAGFMNRELWFQVLTQHLVKQVRGGLEKDADGKYKPHQVLCFVCVYVF